MATLRDIRQRIQGVKSTSKITSAMKMVATAKLKRAQTSIESARPYFRKIDYILSNLVSSLSDDYTHPLLRKTNEIKNIALVVVTSDRGLCGSFNTNLLKEAIRHSEELKKQYPEATIHFVAIGRKGISFLKKRNYNVIAEFQGIFAQLNFEHTRQIVDVFTGKFIEGQYDKVVVVTNEFINVMRQVPSIRNVLPIENIATSTKSNTSVDYIFEPSKEAIIDDLLPKLVDIKIWSALLESNAAEQASRRIAMDNATRNAKELITFLELQYNKARQADITKEMLEIIGGADALKSA
jgi:F-type H+-transporting ATPase subunit gamma